MTRRLAIGGVMGMAACLILALQTYAGEEDRQSKETTKPKPGQSKETTKPREDQNEMQPYLGVAVEPLPALLAKQLPQTKGRGVVIAQVAKDSPAQKAGLKRFDVLLSYDGQHLYSPEQLVRLVQKGKAGQEAVLEVLRAGKEEKLQVTLGEHQRHNFSEAHHRMPRHFAEEHFPTNRLEDKESRWSTFDSMSLSRVGDKHFKAKISYRDDKGKLEHKSFEGTRQEIHKAIQNEKDMPAVERNQLLRALDLQPRFFEFGLPPFMLNHRFGGLWDSEDLDQDPFSNSQ